MSLIIAKHERLRSIIAWTEVKLTKQNELGERLSHYLENSDKDGSSMDANKQQAADPERQKILPESDTRKINAYPALRYYGENLQNCSA